MRGLSRDDSLAAEMEFHRRIRPLYLLALFQLVAGPFVLFQVTMLCQLAVRETPEHGVAGAISEAWKSPEFQAALANPEALAREKPGLPDPDPKSSPLKVKMPCLAWQAAPFALVNPARWTSWSDSERDWAPAWSQPPPGPPPRVG